MADPAILYCVGATKAGTSWLYRTLHDHPECHLRAVKEAHYWDTFDAATRTRQTAAFNHRLVEFQTARDAAQAQGIGWKVANLNRRINDMTALIAVVAGDRQGDKAYRDWLCDGVGDRRLVADMTPNYATLPDNTFARMARLGPVTRFVYLIRDPLARLWSHVRMQAERQRQPHEAFEQKATNILTRILNRGQETHILERGDYPATVARLRRTIPADTLRVEYCERLFTEDGLRDMSAFLGLTYHAANGAAPAHEGPKATLDAGLAAKAVAFLKEHYDWAAGEIGPLPAAWQDNLARIAA